jgi:hypothetical protein
MEKPERSESHMVPSRRHDYYAVFPNDLQCRYRRMGIDGTVSHLPGSDQGFQVKAIILFNTNNRLVLHYYENHFTSYSVFLRFHVLSSDSNYSPAGLSDLG